MWFRCSCWFRVFTPQVMTFLHVLCLLSSSADVHHQHHQDQVQPSGQACALSGHALFGLPHRPQPCLRVPKPLLGRGGRVYTGISGGPVSGEDDGMGGDDYSEVVQTCFRVNPNQLGDGRSLGRRMICCL